MRTFRSDTPKESPSTQLWVPNTWIYFLQKQCGVGNPLCKDLNRRLIVEARVGLCLWYKQPEWGAWSFFFNIFLIWVWGKNNPRSQRHGQWSEESVCMDKDSENGHWQQLTGRIFRLILVSGHRDTSSGRRTSFLQPSLWEEAPVLGICTGERSSGLTQPPVLGFPRQSQPACLERI